MEVGETDVRHARERWVEGKMRTECWWCRRAEEKKQKKKGGVGD